jgi:hypothetical protein
MGLRCSLFGCEYGDSEIEREREDHGGEVVLTVREFQSCRHCDETRLISENTGVTTVERREEPDDDDVDIDIEVEAKTPKTDTVEQLEDAAESVGRPDPTSDAEVEDKDEPPTDDAVILDDGPDPTTNPEPRPEPDHTEGEIETVDTDGALDLTEVDVEDERENDGAVILDDGPDPTTDPDRDHGEWPEVDATTDDAPDNGSTPWPAAPGTDTETTGGGTVTVTATESDPTATPRTDEDARTETESTFSCPACHHSVSADGTAHRAGDICPECYRDYLG